MSLKLNKIIEDIFVKGLFPECAYLYDMKEKYTYKTLDFDRMIWKNPDTLGEIIQNGSSGVLAYSDDRVEFIDDTHGEILAIEDFQAYGVQLNSPFEKDRIFGYKNAVYVDNTFYFNKDVGYFSCSEDEFIVCAKQYENGRIVWISDDKLIFLKKYSIEFMDDDYNIFWDVSFHEMQIGQFVYCFDYENFIFIVGDKGKLFKLDMATGDIVSHFQSDYPRAFYSNYFIKDGKLLFLGGHSYLEISPEDFKVLRKIDLKDEDIFVSNCFFSHADDCIYFFGTYGDSFPNIIGRFNLASVSFDWKFILKPKNDDNAFYFPPEPVGDFIVSRDGLNNLYIFEK